MYHLHWRFSSLLDQLSSGRLIMFTELQCSAGISLAPPISANHFKNIFNGLWNVSLLCHATYKLLRLTLFRNKSWRKSGTVLMWSLATQQTGQFLATFSFCCSWPWTRLISTLTMSPSYKSSGESGRVWSSHWGHIWSLWRSIIKRNGTFANTSLNCWHMCNPCNKLWNNIWLNW